MDEELRNRIRKLRKLVTHVLSPLYREDDFDSHLVDCPFLFRHSGC